VALLAQNAVFALTPRDPIRQSRAILRGVREVFWGPSEVAGVMCVVAAFRVV
jgi:hypothetical protein